MNKQFQRETSLKRRAEKMETFLAGYKTTAFTKRVIDRFLQIDRWDFFAPVRKQMEFLFQESLCRQFTERIKSFAEVIDLSQNRLTMRGFYEICRRKNITVRRHKREVKNILGEYFYGSQDTIWLLPELRGQLLLEIAAHELSHFCLHRESAISSGKLIPYAKAFGQHVIETDSRRIWGEIEADLMAAMLLTKKEKK